MNTPHPMITNLLALGELATWQTSLELAEEGASAWSDSARRFDIQRIYFVGCGTSLYNGQVGKHVVEHIAGLPAEAIPAFAFSAYAEPAVLGAGSLVVGISTTGETEAVCDALEHARQSGAATLAITAHANSSVARAAEAVILTGGQDDQISVKTKSYVQALVSIYVLALYLAESGGAVDEQRKIYWKNQITLAAEGATQFLSQQRPEIETLAHTYARAVKVFILGTGPNSGTAEEASLKVIEMAKMYSESQELENFFHGRLREVDQTSPMFFIAPDGRASQRVLDFLTVTDHVHAPSVVLTDQVTAGIQRLATHVIHMPGGLDEFATPLLYILPLHLFGYEMALQRGYDPASRRYDIVPQKVRYQGEEDNSS